MHCLGNIPSSQCQQQGQGWTLSLSSYLLLKNHITKKRHLFLETFQSKLLIHKNKTAPEKGGHLFCCSEVPWSTKWPTFGLGILSCLLIFLWVYKMSVKRLIKISSSTYFSFTVPFRQMLSFFLFKKLEGLHHIQKYSFWDRVAAASLQPLQLLASLYLSFNQNLSLVTLLKFGSFKLWCWNSFVSWMSGIWGSISINLLLCLE